MVSFFYLFFSLKDQKHDHSPYSVQDLHCHCGLLSITALAEGQTLTSAEIVIFAELVWTPGTIDQCEGRAHRIGQQGSVLIQYLLLQDSEVDRRCYQHPGSI